MLIRDLVRTVDSGLVRLRTKAGAIIAGREWGEHPESIVECKGWVKIVARERGKLIPGCCREGKNVWTTTGREYDALRKSQEPLPGGGSICYRVDMVGYLGVGIGSQVESVDVLALASPVAYAPGLFLKALDWPTFPLMPSRTVVEYHCVFSEDEITFSEGAPVDVSEFGLFTTGNPFTPNASGPRELDLASASRQSPVAYKIVEPVRKNNALELDVAWQIRH